MQQDGQLCGSGSRESLGTPPPPLMPAQHPRQQLLLAPHQQLPALLLPSSMHLRRPRRHQELPLALPPADAAGAMVPYLGQGKLMRVCAGMAPPPHLPVAEPPTTAAHDRCHKHAGAQLALVALWLLIVCWA